MSRFLTCLFILGVLAGFSQSSYIPLNESYYHTIDRYEIRNGSTMPQYFSSVKPYKRSDVVAFVLANDSLAGFQSPSDQFNRTYLLNDSWEWSGAETNNSRKPILKHFYRKKSDFYHVSEPAFDLHVNPVIYFAGGKDDRGIDSYFINTRGVEVRGMIDGKVGFYTYLTDNQATLPSYVNDVINGDFPDVEKNRIIPHEGFWKKNAYGGGVDYLQARGYITFEASKHINIQFGHDRFFIGNGYRSLIFSDNGPPSLFLKANARVWKINYLFFLTKMYADNVNGPSGKYPEKFVALHHLSINIGKKFNLGVFESVVFSPSDSTTFEWSYLNPIIFYRGIEQQGGSSDNVILGVDFKWNAFKGIQLYGQFVLDEFVLDHIRKGDGWWANKFGVQAGAKYIDAFGISNLDLQGEINVVRPYTYSHYTNYGNYSNFRQAIAHPLGANFQEIDGILRYQPVPKLTLVGKLTYAKVGRDTLSQDWGGNILIPNTSREMEFNNKIAQGVQNTITMMSFTASWQLKHNIFIDLNAVIRRSESPVAFYNRNSTLTSVALRVNIPQRLYEF